MADEPDFSKGASGPADPYSISGDLSYLSSSQSSAVSGSSVAGTKVQKNGAVVGTEAQLDFEDGDILWTVTDDSGATRVKVQPFIGTSKVTSAMIVDGTIVDGDVAAANKDGAAGTPSLRTLGTGAAQACAGNDSRLSSGAAWSAWTPTLTATTTNPLIGINGSTSGRYIQNGKTVVAQGWIKWGNNTISAGNGVYLVDYPVAPNTSLATARGSALFYDTVGGSGYLLVPVYYDGTHFQFFEGTPRIFLDNSSTATGGAFTELHFALTYEAA